MCWAHSSHDRRHYFAWGLPEWNRAVIRYLCSTNGTIRSAFLPRLKTFSAAHNFGNGRQTAASLEVHCGAQPSLWHLLHPPGSRKVYWSLALSPNPQPTHITAHIAPVALHSSFCSRSLLWMALALVARLQRYICVLHQKFSSSDYVFNFYFEGGGLEGLSSFRLPDRSECE